jgi:hypothetical protein
MAFRRLDRGVAGRSFGATTQVPFRIELELATIGPVNDCFCFELVWIDP